MKTRLIAIAVISSVASAAHAEPIDASRATETAVRNNPALHAAMLDVQASESAVLAEEDRYPLTLQLDGGYTHSSNPSLSRDDDSVLTTRGDTVVLGSELEKVWSFGTAVNLRLEGSWSRFSTPLFPGSDEEVTLGPAYAAVARLTVLQPLLRGFGNDIGEAELRQAHVRHKAAESARDRAASELLRDVLVAYWELWYASEALRIEERATELATRERDDVAARIEAGAIAEVEIFPFRTRVAELEEATLAAQLERRRRAVELGARLGQPGVRSADLVAEDDPPLVAGTRPREATLARALEASPELAEAEARIALAREAESVAGELDRQRLDLEGWVQTEGLGNQRVPPALKQFGTFGAVSAHIGLVWELPLTGSRYDHQKRRASLDLEAEIARRASLRDAIETDVTLLMDRLDLASQRLALAERTAEIAREQLKAANERYDEGAGLAIEIQRAEDAVRQAELRQARARIDAVTTELMLEHVTGELLSRSRGLIERMPGRPTTTGLRMGGGPF